MPRYFDVTAWGKLAENTNSLGTKGRGVRVVGRIKQDRWTDANGKAQAKIVIIAEHIEFRPEVKSAPVKETETETESESESNEDELKLAVGW
jgi:single-strand DNA-binding protein